MTKSLHPAQISIQKLLENCRVERTRRGGPGGQHRNKVETAIVITHQPTGIVGQASERRSQHVNRDKAINRLRLNLAVGHRIALPVDHEPTELWKSRALGGKISVSSNHDDFPSILSEALDYLAGVEFEPAAAANRLNISSSQLVKLLKSFRPALEYINSERKKRGLTRLR